MVPAPDDVMHMVSMEAVRYSLPMVVQLNHFLISCARTGLVEGEHDYVSWSRHKLLRLVDRGLADRHGIDHGLAPDQFADVSRGSLNVVSSLGRGLVG